MNTQSQNKREQQLDHWLTNVFENQPFSRQKLIGDASFRGYHRLILTEKNTPYIIMDAPPEKESIHEFIQVNQLLQPYVYVPKLFAIERQLGFIVMEDLGKVDFADVIGAEDMPKTQQYYHQAMQTILAMQQIPLSTAQTVLPSYDEARLSQEMALFDEWFLPYFKIDLNDHQRQLWQALQAAIIQQVNQQPQVVVHRDFHSRNLMVVGENLAVIDFQDAVIGAYSYDVVSLLRDAYVHWSKQQTLAWFQDYYQMLSAQLPVPDYQQFLMDCMVMGLQRHLKILGIFVRLSQRDGKNRYLANLPRVMSDAMIESQWLAENSQNHVYQDFYHWLTQEIYPKFSQQGHVC